MDSQEILLEHAANMLDEGRNLIEEPEDLTLETVFSAPITLEPNIQVNNSTLLVNIDRDSNGSNVVQYCRAIPIFKKFSEKLIDLCSYIHKHCSNNEIITLVKTHDRLVDILLSAQTNEEAIAVFQENREFSRAFLSHTELPIIADMLPIPSIDACLAIKDTLNISDSGWIQMSKVFQFPKNLRISSIRRYRKNCSDVPRLSSSGRGYSYLLREMIRHAIITEKIPVDSSIQVKLSLDAGTAMKGSRVQVEAFCMDVIQFGDSR